MMRTDFRLPEIWGVVSTRMMACPAELTSMRLDDLCSGVSKCGEGVG